MHAHASLNRIYRLVWSAVFQTWVVASELTRGRGKSNATPLLNAALLVSLAGLSGNAGFSSLHAINCPYSVTSRWQA